MIAVILNGLVFGTARTASAFSIGPRPTDGALRVSEAGFVPTLGLTRQQVESIFIAIDGQRTTFKIVSKVKGVPRVLGGDRTLFTVVEINGFPKVLDVQVVTVLDTSTKLTLENQVTYDTLTCRAFAGAAGQRWCTGRILNTDSKGLVTASKSKLFNGVRIAVRTYRSSASSTVPIVSVDVSATYTGHP
ncbi:MAG: hypothetical protein ACHQFZ_02300 [Acidimicrobiales bacterium]